MPKVAANVMITGMQTGGVTYPDLRGKTAVVAGVDLAGLRAVVDAFAGNDVNLAVVAGERVDPPGRNGYAVVGDIGDAGLWPRVLPHVEQRLGPIDIAVSIGRTALLDAVSPDMSARGRGVAILVGEGNPPSAPRGRQVTGGTADDLAAAVLLCASDTLTAVRATIQLG